MDRNILILGASGMLGHKMMQVLSTEDNFNVIGTVRDIDTKKYKVINEYPLIGNVDASKFDTVSYAIDKCNPDYIINCIGIVKQLPESNDPIKSLLINSVLPRKLATYCTANDIKLFHISTDCVFDGELGMYKEYDVPNASDIYGLTKFIGEVNDKYNLTLRTSIIGREIMTKHGLVEWFLSNRGKTVNGYTKSIFSGVTTHELSHVISNIIKYSYLSSSYHKEFDGLYHIASEPINKFDLLTLINEYLTESESIKIIPIDGEYLNRSLDGSKIENTDGYIPPSWHNMIHEMMNDPTPYDKIRRNHALCV